MAPVSVHSLGCSSFGVSVTHASPDYSSSAAVKSSFPSLSAPVATSPGRVSCPAGGALPGGWPSPGLRSSSSSKEPCL